jgi:hypothetical protein
MRTLRILHANRLAVVLGSGLLCLLGFVAGCDSGDSTSGPGAPTAESKAKEEAEAKARKEAFGRKGIPSQSSAAKPKS